MTMAPEHATSPVIVMLAAGESQRFGGIKQLAELDGQAMVRRSVLTAIETGRPVVVVTGANAAQIESVLDDLPIRIARHPQWQEGMGSSLAAGVGHVADHFPHASGVMVCLADQPLIDATIYTAMLQRHGQAADRVLVTEYNDVSGPPALFPRDCFAKLRACSGARGAHALIEQEAARVERFPASDLIDVDTLADLQRVRERMTRKKDR
jgi:molybdenum cofactor cytidylyltransferase